MEKLPPLPPLNGPLEFQVYCCTWIPRLKLWKWHRVSTASSLDSANRIIEEDAGAMFGRPGGLLSGLIEAGGSRLRVYRIFQVQGEWKQVGEDDIRKRS